MVNAPAERDDLPGKSEGLRIARIIYETVYGAEIAEGEMPSFDEARAEELDGYERAMEAAAMVGFQIQPLGPRPLHDVIREVRSHFPHAE